MNGLPLVSLFIFLGPSLRSKLATYGDEQDGAVVISFHSSSK